MADKPTRREWLKISALSGSALAFATFDLKPEARARNKPGKLIKLSSNENPYGFSPKVRAAILDSIADGNRYANPELVARLEQRIAEREGVKAENVVLGTGS